MQVVCFNWSRICLFQIILAFCIPVSNSTARKRKRPFLKTPFSFSHWGINRVNQLSKGELGILQEKKQNKLLLYRLLTRSKKRKYSPSQRFSQEKYRPSFRGNCFLLSHFDHNNTNRLGGLSRTFQKKPSHAQLSIKKDKKNRWSLHLQFQKKKKGFCGAWMHFFTSTQSPKNRLYLDARKITTLTFWVKRTTNATIILRLADAKRHRKGKALRLGRLSSFLQKPSKKGKWQRVIVPLRRFKKRIALKQLAAFVFEIVTPGKGRLQIKTFSFCRVPKRLPKLPPITPSNKKKKDFVKASWLWNTKQILRSKHKQSVMLRFLRSQGINRLFIQLPQKITSTPSLKDFAPYRKRLRKLLKKLNLAKIQTYAMIGRPEYALQKWHKRLFQLTQAIGKFNKKGRKKERFTGLHLDIEAYRISGFWGVRKKSIINQYLHLLKRLKIKTQKLSLRLSLDLPFWFDSPNLIKNQKHSDISKTLSEKLIDLADDINIMDYRTRLYGPNGLLILVQDELKYASQKGKPILIALETHEVANEHLLLFHGKAKRGFPKLSRTKKTKQKFYLFATQKAGKAQGTFWFVPRHRLKEWRIYASQKLRSRKKIWYWPIRRNIFLPANQISFAFSSHSFLKKRMRQLKEELQRYQAFAGFGIHHVGSYRKLFQNR